MLSNFIMRKYWLTFQRNIINSRLWFTNLFALYNITYISFIYTNIFTMVIEHFSNVLFIVNVFRKKK